MGGVVGGQEEQQQPRRAGEAEANEADEEEPERRQVRQDQHEARPARASRPAAGRRPLSPRDGRALRCRPSRTPASARRASRRSTRLPRGDRLPGHLTAVAVLLDRPPLRRQHLVDLQVRERRVPLPEVEPAHRRDRDEGAEDDRVADRPRGDGEHVARTRTAARPIAGVRSRIVRARGGRPLRPGASASTGPRSAPGRGRARG